MNKTAIILKIIWDLIDHFPHILHIYIFHHFTTIRFQLLLLLLLLQLGSIGTPTAQIHDSPQGLLWLLSLSAWTHGRRWRRRDLPGLRKRPRIVLSLLLNRPHGMVPSAEPLILQRLHWSHTCCHITHLQFLRSLIFHNR